MPADERILRASEIGEYVFCHRAWWLHRVQGFESANRALMEAGVIRHAQHGRAVQHAAALRRTAIVILVVALFFALAFIFAIIFSWS